MRVYALREKQTGLWVQDDRDGPLSKAWFWASRVEALDWYGDTYEAVAFEATRVPKKAKKAKQEG